MRKKIIDHHDERFPSEAGHWLQVDQIAEVQVSSEDASYPIEAALVPGQGLGWKAARPGKQTIRLVFDEPQSLHRIWINFEETDHERTQEYVLRWSADRGQSFKEIVRQQWNFSPPTTTHETEDHRVELSAVTLLDLTINPDISGGQTPATLARLLLA